MGRTSPADVTPESPIPPFAEDGGRAVLTWLRDMRNRHPVWYDASNHFWNVYRYADVRQALAEPSVFSSDLSPLNPRMSHLQRGTMTRLDPPMHHKLRRLVSQSFTPKRVADLAPRITQVAQELLGQASGSEQLDLIGEFAYPLPVTVIAELLGVPWSDRELFRRWADHLLSIPRGDVRSEGFVTKVEEALREMDEYLLRHCRARRQRPGDDLISALVEGEVEGERLDDEEVVNFSRLLLVAGHITTTLLLGNTVLCLDENQRAASQLRADRALIPAALEEVLRVRS